jgi:hypothetical protein
MYARPPAMAIKRIIKTIRGELTRVTLALSYQPANLDAA